MKRTKAKEIPCLTRGAFIHDVSYLCPCQRHGAFLDAGSAMKLRAGTDSMAPPKGRLAVLHRMGAKEVFSKTNDKANDGPDKAIQQKVAAKC